MSEPVEAAGADAVGTVGILGAGKLGTVLARLAVAAGYRVLVAASGTPERIALTLSVMAPGAVPVSAADAVAADVVVLALPLHRLPTLDAAALRGRVVVDATNHWEDVDGPLPEFVGDARGTSAVVQDLLPGARIVKAFSHVGYHDLAELAGAGMGGSRVALGIASDDEAAAAVVASFVERLGFEAVPIGELARGWTLQAHSPVFGATMTRDDLVETVSRCDEHARQGARS